jgi:hypothetical protein
MFSSDIKEGVFNSQIWRSNTEKMGKWRKREYESVETWRALHLNKTAEQDFLRLQMSHECRCDGNKYLQNVSLAGEQQSTFLVLRSRFNLECFIYFTPGKKERGKKGTEQKRIVQACPLQLCKWGLISLAPPSLSLSLIGAIWVEMQGNFRTRADT